jgi:hypothetical protein
MKNRLTQMVTSRKMGSVCWGVEGRGIKRRVEGEEGYCQKLT